MFTGIIEGQAVITRIWPAGGGKRLALDSDFVLDETRIGDSIAINGSCLTVVSVDEKRFEVDVSPETLSVTTLAKASVGQRVNVERALRLSDRIDGHLVTGHVDGTGMLNGRKKEGNAILLEFAVPESVGRYLVKKGSVAVDGISLTVNDCGHRRFNVSIIPHTAAMTTIDVLKVGDTVNIETDIIGKYVESFLSNRGTAAVDDNNSSSIDRAFLASKGYL